MHIATDRLYNATVHLALILVCLCAIYPIYYVFLVSVSDAKYVVTLFPKGFRSTNYELILRQNSILRSYFITLVYCSLGTAISLLLTALMAYPLTIRSFRFRSPVTILLTITIFFNGGLIPSYMVVRSLGMINTIWAIVLPTSVAAWNVIIYRILQYHTGQHTGIGPHGRRQGVHHPVQADITAV